MFWKQVSQNIINISKTLHKNEKLWISTHGLGIYYLHVRISKKPKYYITSEFIYYNIIYIIFIYMNCEICNIVLQSLIYDNYIINNCYYCNNNIYICSYCSEYFKTYNFPNIPNVYKNIIYELSNYHKQCKDCYHIGKQNLYEYCNMCGKYYKLTNFIECTKCFYTNCYNCNTNNKCIICEKKIL